MSLLLPDRAHYFDGDRPIPQPAELKVEKGDLLIRRGDEEPIRWPLTEIRRIADGAAQTNAVLRWTGDPLARLILKDANVMRYMPHLNRTSPPKGRARLAAWALAAVGAVGIQIGVLIPLLADNLAGFIPVEGERALGEATFGHIREALDETGLKTVDICENPSGQAVLEELVARLSAGQDLRQEISVAVLDHKMINAFALPGGYVVLFKGLIQAASGPDEVAAVLGHEIGHVVSRDPTRHALRSAGSIGVLGLLFGDFAGGAAVLFLTERLISASYSQGAETGADVFAHEVLADAGISPGALGDMFENMRRKHGENDGLAAHFLSHPSLGDRIEAAAAAVDPGVEYQPSMSETDWLALQKICR
jgi:predicted Zn-dependent protease